jgi:hypothetical protein
MTRTRSHRRIEMALVAALGVIALLALPGFAAARAGNHHGGGHHRAGHHHRMNRAHSSLLVIHGSAGAGSVEGENAGEVESFDGTMLTIKLFAGGTISGKVTESTEIECEHQEAEPQASEDQQSGSEDSQGEDQQSGDEGQSGEDSGEARVSDVQASDEPSDEEDQAASCGTANLVPGAVVHEAELALSHEGAVFRSVDLAG